MNDRRITIVVNTCDAYQDVLKLFFAALDEYWPELDFPVVINSELLDYNEYNAITHLVEDKSISWGGRLISTLDSIDTEFVLMLYDDFILEDYVKIFDLQKAEQLLVGDPEAAVVYLMNSNLKVSEENNKNHFLKIVERCDYRLNSCPAIWRRKDLLSFTGISDDPWAWEFFGSYRSVTKNKFFYTLNTIYPNIISYNQVKGGAIYRGKWVKDVVENKILKYNLDIDLNIRGCSDSILYEKRTVLWKINFLIIGYKMIGIKSIIPLVNYCKIKFVKWL